MFPFLSYTLLEKSTLQDLLGEYGVLHGVAFEVKEESLPFVTGDNPVPVFSVRMAGHKACLFFTQMEAPLKALSGPRKDMKHYLVMQSFSYLDKNCISTILHGEYLEAGSGPLREIIESGFARFLIEKMTQGLDSGVSKDVEAKDT